MNHYAHLELRDIGVSEGALIREHVIVAGGKDGTGSEVFQFTPWACGKDYSRRYASDYISGVTFNPKLTYEGMGDIVW